MRLQGKAVKAPYKGIIRTVQEDLTHPQGWWDMENFITRNGMPQLVPGYKKLTDYQFDSSIAYIDEFFLKDGSMYLLIATLTTLYQWVAGNDPVDLGATFTGDLNNIFCSDIWTPGDLYFITNGKDAVMSWDGSAAIAALGGLTDCEPGGIEVNTAKIVRCFENFVVLLNTTEEETNYPQRFRWCVRGSPTVWKNTDGLGEAGYDDIEEGADWIVGAELFRDDLAIYKERSIHRLTYVGPPTTFYRRRVVDGVGLLGQRAIVSLGDEHFFVGSDNFYLFTGEGIEPIGDEVRDLFFESVNPQKLDQVFCFMLEETAEIIVAYPSTSSDTPDKFLAYNYASKSWGKGSRPLTALGYYQVESTVIYNNLVGTIAEQTMFWDQRLLLEAAPINLMGDVDGYLYRLEDGVDADGTPIDGYLEILDRDFGAPDFIKRLQRLEVEFDSPSNDEMEVYIGCADNSNGTYTWYGPYTISMQDRLPIVDCDLSARYFGFRFKTKTGKPFKLKMYKPFYIVRRSME